MFSGVQKNDSGFWTCIVRNEYGEDRASNQLTVLDADYQLEDTVNSELIEPDYLELPSSIQLIKATANELTIKWNAARLKETPLDLRLQITGYQVSYFSATFADKKEAKEKPINWKSILTQNTNITIDNLEPSSGYIFTIRSQTKYGLSVPSNLSEEFYTASSTSNSLIPQSSMPLIKSQFDLEKLLNKVFKLRKQLTYIQIQLLRAKSVNSTTIRLVWQTNPPNVLSTINGYLIYYRIQSYTDQQYNLEQIDSDDLEADQRIDPNSVDSNLHSSFHTHHYHHLKNHHSISSHSSFKLKVLNNSLLNSALIYDLQPFSTYEFFIIAYHSPYLLSMPSNIAVGRTAEALPIRSPSRIYLKVFEATYPALITNQQNTDFEDDKNKDFYPNSMMFSSSNENLDTNTLFKNDQSLLTDDDYSISSKAIKRLAVEISWSHVPEIYWRGIQKAYRLDFQLIQNGQSMNNMYSRQNSGSGSFQIHVASNMPQLLHNPANHLHNNTITLNNLTIGASYLLRISACSSAGCGVNSPPVPLKMTNRFSYSLLDEPKPTSDDQLKFNSVDKNKQANKNELDNTVLNANSNHEINNKKEQQQTVYTKTTNLQFLDQSVQTVLICSAAIFVFFLLSFLLLLGILFICKNRKLNLKNKTMNINSYIAVAKENCDKLNGQSQQMRLLAPPNIKKIQNGNTLWSDSLIQPTSSNTPISSNTSSARSRIGLPPIPSSNMCSINSSQPQLLINVTNGDNFSTNSNFSVNSNNQEENQACNGYAELESIDCQITKNFNGKNKNQFINYHDTLTNQQQQNTINQTNLSESTTQPYATTTLMTFSNAFNAERELIQADAGSSDQSIKLSIGTNHLNSLNSGSQQLQQHFQSNQFKTTNSMLSQQHQTNGTLCTLSDLDSGSEVYGVSRTSLRKLNINGLESCSSIDSLTSNQRIGRVRQLIEKEDETGSYYHQPYDHHSQSHNIQLNNKTNHFHQPLKSEIMRINSISSHSSNNSPIQTRTRFLNNNSFRTTTSFTGSQLIEDGLQLKTKPNLNNLGARQKSESNLIGNNKFSIVCNPIDNFNDNYQNNRKGNQEPDNEYNTFDDQLENRMNKFRKYYQTTKSMNSDQLKSFLNSGQQNDLNSSFKNSRSTNQEKQSLMGIYDLVSEDANN